MRRKRREPLTCWFEEGSLFFTRLTTELEDTPHKITALRWTGKNSIRARERAAHCLAEHLSTEETEHQEATRLIIAHSHGGNVALRALHQLKQRDASQLSGAERPSPLVVTLATPFVEVHHSDFGDRPTNIRIAITVAVWFLFFLSITAVLPPVGERRHGEDLDA
jgi:hypothetical protein